MNNTERLERLSNRDFEREYLQIPIAHDDKACEAYIAYETQAHQFDLKNPTRKIGENGVIIYLRPTPIPQGYTMQSFADRYETTVQAMKEHWRCHKPLEKEFGDS